MRILLLVAGALALGAVGCGGDDVVATDGGASGDSGADAGARVDGGGPADGGGGIDAGPGVDAGPPPECAPPTLPPLDTEDIAPDHTFNAPVFVTQAPGVTDTLWVVEQVGRILLVRDGVVLDTPFLDIRTRVAYGGERGLLGLAFHPDYESNGRFFIYYTPSAEHHNVVAEYRRGTAGPLVADPTEVRQLIDVRDLEDNHNGGMIAFGPDGYLYTGHGDGGGGGDNHGEYGNGLNLNTELGKILRLDVEAEGAPGAAFAAPGNPFEGGGGLPQIWAYGLRNPWRFSFDRATGDLYIGDVGQGRWEEIDIQPADSTGGENYGWRAYEGYEVYSADDVGRVAEHAEPVLAVGHDSDTELLRGACSITGGYVYRGTAIPDLRGVYLFGDYCSGDVGAFRWCEGEVMGAQRVADLRAVHRGLVSFGEDNAGEMYIAYIRDGRVVKIVPGG